MKCDGYTDCHAGHAVAPGGAVIVPRFATPSLPPHVAMAPYPMPCRKTHSNITSNVIAARA